MTTNVALLAGVFINVDLREKFFGFKAHHPLAWAGDLIVTLPSPTSDTDAAERVFTWAQRADNLNACDGVTAFVGGAWRTDLRTGDAWLDENRVPSLSVGDVVLLGPLNRGTAGHWYSVDRFGFTQIDAPTNVDWRPGRVRSAMEEALDKINS